MHKILRFFRCIVNADTKYSGLIYEGLTECIQNQYAIELS